MTPTPPVMKYIIDYVYNIIRTVVDCRCAGGAEHQQRKSGEKRRRPHFAVFSSSARGSFCDPDCLVVVVSSRSSPAMYNSRSDYCHETAAYRWSVGFTPTRANRSATAAIVCPHTRARARARPYNIIKY